MPTITLPIPLSPSLCQATKPDTQSGIERRFWIARLSGSRPEAHDAGKIQKRSAQVVYTSTMQPASPLSLALKTGGRGTMDSMLASAPLLASQTADGADPPSAAPPNPSPGASRTGTRSSPCFRTPAKRGLRPFSPAVHLRARSKGACLAGSLRGDRILVSLFVALLGGVSDVALHRRAVPLS